MKQERLDEIIQHLNQVCDIDDEYDAIYALQQMGYRRNDAKKIYSEICQKDQDIEARTEIIDDGTEVLEA